MDSIGIDSLGSDLLSRGDAAGLTTLEGHERESLPLLVWEAGEIENRLRQHALELTEPAISRTVFFEGKLKELRTTADKNAEGLKQLNQQLSSQENLRKVVDSFRSELGEWDKERRDHEHLLNEKTCLQENELTALRKMIEVQAYSTEACQRGLRTMGDLLAATKEEVTQLRDYCSERVDINRDKIMKLRDEVESKFSATESSQFKLRDEVTNMATVFHHVNLEMERIGLVTAETMESVADLWRDKATAATVEEQQQTFIEFQRNLNDSVAALRLQLNNVVDEVKDHFQTAVRVISTSTSRQIESMRVQYSEDIGRLDEVMQQNENINHVLQDTEDKAREHLEKLQADMEVQIQELKSGLQEKVKSDPISEQYVLEVQQLRRAWKEHEEHLALHDRARALERDAMHAIMESQLIAAQMNIQDDQDRKNVALFGCKPERSDRDGLLPNIDQTPRKREAKPTAPIISLDKRCLSCCSGTGTVLAGFKIACLNYAPGPVEYHQVPYSRTELLHLQAKLLDQAQDRMHRAAGV